MVDVNLVFQGGGIKGIAFVGALKALEEKGGVRIRGTAGASAGAIIASLYAVGYGADELRKELSNKPLASLVDRPFLKKLRFIQGKGLYRATGINEWLYSLYKKKFDERKTQKLLWPCYLISANISTGNYDTYKTDEPEPQELANAVTKSCTIPLFFRPYIDGNSLYVDGGLLSNYPLWLFEESDYPTIGFRLVTDEWHGATVRSDIVHYLKSLVSTMLNAHDEFGRGNPLDVFSVPIEIREKDVGKKLKATDFEAIDKVDESALFGCGYQAMSRFDWARVPSSDRIDFRDRYAAEILATTVRNIARVLVEDDPKKGIRYESYDMVVRFKCNGTVEETRTFVVENRGPDQLTMIKFDWCFDEDVNTSYRAFEPRVECDLHDCVVLPVENGRRKRAIALVFIPSLGVGEKRRFKLTINLPGCLPYYARGETDQYWVLVRSKEGAGSACVTIRVDGPSIEINDRDLRPADRVVETVEEANYICYRFENVQSEFKVGVRFRPVH